MTVFHAPVLLPSASIVRAARGIDECAKPPVSLRLAEDEHASRLLWFGRRPVGEHGQHAHQILDARSLILWGTNERWAARSILRRR